MLEVDKRIIELLKKGVTLQKLKSKSQLCQSDLVKKIHGLENKGYLINKIFNEYGVKFIISDVPVVALQDKVTIPNEAKFTFLVISDTHLGNIYENIEMLNKVYKYAEDQNIRYIFHLGDMIEGPALENQSPARIKRLDIHDQVDFVTRNYPKSDNVTTLYILGNHDYRCLQEGIDISKIISNRRLDMHFLGYKNSQVNIGNRTVLLHHPFNIVHDQKYDDEIKELYLRPEFDLVLRGHTHHNGIYTNEMDSIVLNVPACYSSPSRVYTGAYEITFKNDELLLQSLILSDELYPFTSIKYPLKPKQLVKTPGSSSESRVDKFNSKYKRK